MNPVIETIFYGAKWGIFNSMKIDSYTYGSMTVDGKAYKKDLIIFPDKVKSNWWREEGHTLNIDDLAEILEAKPKLLIAGTGESGFMCIPPATKLALKEKNIELIAVKTDKAAQIFNKKSQISKDIVGAFHLTC